MSVIYRGCYPPKEWEFGRPCATVSQLQNMVEILVCRIRDRCCDFDFVVIPTKFTEYINIEIKVLNCIEVSGEDVKNFIYSHLREAFKRVKSDLFMPVCFEVTVDLIPVISNIDMVISFNDEEDGDMLSIPEVKEIRHTNSKRKGDLFTVIWSDNTQTTIRLMEGDTPDDLVAFMYCASIKMFGSKGECRKYVAEKQEVFKDRVRRRSEELRLNRQRRNLELEQRKEVPYAGGLCVPALAKSPMFKKNCERRVESDRSGGVRK